MINYNTANSGWLCKPRVYFIAIYSSANRLSSLYYRGLYAPLDVHPKAEYCASMFLKQSWPQEGREASPEIVELPVVDDAEVDVGLLVVIIDGDKKDVINVENVGGATVKIIAVEASAHVKQLTSKY